MHDAARAMARVVSAARVRRRRWIRRGDRGNLGGLRTRRNLRGRPRWVPRTGTARRRRRRPWKTPCPGTGTGTGRGRGRYDLYRRRGRDGDGDGTTSAGDGDGDGDGTTSAGDGDGDGDGDVDPPPPLDAPCDGYATRYWDCCKAHCGWEGNVNPATQPLQSCDAGDATLGADYGVVSACTTPAPGSAFTCFNMNPWAVSADVAYGSRGGPGQRRHLRALLSARVHGRGPLQPGGSGILAARGQDHDRSGHEYWFRCRRRAVRHIDPRGASACLMRAATSGVWTARSSEPPTAVCSPRASKTRRTAPRARSRRACWGAARLCLPTRRSRSCSTVVSGSWAGITPRITPTSSIKRCRARRRSSTSRGSIGGPSMMQACGGGGGGAPCTQEEMDAL